ncbi:hypothetical protein QWY31_10205 [Cytophagales bacterium LB-30]|uniref:Outer membrane protein beta-barrel domain-containing protein n=1 Tax=Shiella aurantiaca TaxID=3058365 RepID=A0ABT8F665_9BACT|nr:hypothetical protein [Shiella aurantiaca]MDN4165878.1 hypothetical protein [Shiella aurantiaca]
MSKDLYTLFKKTSIFEQNILNKSSKQTNLSSISPHSFYFKVFFLLLAIISNSYKGYSQRNFQPGFVITNQGDSIVGEANWKVSNSSYKECVFRDTANQENTVTYSPNELKGYGFYNGVRYTSYSLNNSLVFMRVIIQGKLSLYKYKGSFFVAKDGSPLIELVNSRVSSKKKVVGQNAYLGVLNYLISDYPQQNNLDLKNVKLNFRSLHRLVSTYNDYFDNGSKSFLYQDNIIEIEVQVIGGITSSRFQIESKIQEYQVLTKPFNTNSNLSLGLGLALNSPYLNPTISIVSFPYWFRAEYYLGYQTSTSFEKRWDEAQINTNQFKIPLGIEWAHGTLKNKIKAGAGFSYTYHIISSNEWTTYTQTNSTITKNYTEVLPLKKNQFGYWLSIGVRKHIFKNINADITLIYEGTNGLSTFDYLNGKSDKLNTSIRNLSCLLSFSF